MTDTNRLYATDLPETKWRKSSFSDGGEQCVEVADLRHTRGRIAVRDSTRPTGPVLTFTPAAFSAFLPHALAA
ncbi:DUF397 domain-containing protein [Streptomyces sp. NBC_00162]|uniref:DUF397 domain-containing protein n=1 Tax=Streptomyces sp. NBC_00162 TaxID=2903629 RepID=UPI00214C2240|nr:DUF397 domain-containing protein [Streptomyces sp. NBC_00162]UUU37534.1 DUF397 domain-containing protein [Streptomyces sp. NBC_00162]